MYVEMLFPILVLGLIFLAPAAFGYGLGRLKSHWKGWMKTIVASLPGPVFLFGATIVMFWGVDVSTPKNCEPPNCSFASVYYWVMISVSIASFLIGLFMGWLGQMFGTEGARRKAAKQ